MAVPATPTIVYPDGDTVDLRRPWPVWLDDASDRTGIEVRIYASGGSTILWTSYLNLATIRRVLWVPADVGLTPGLNFDLEAVVGNADGPSAASAKTLVHTRVSDLLRPSVSFLAWRDAQ